MIAAFPAISWYYLSSGMSWRKEANAELQDFGDVSEFSLKIGDGALASFEDWKNDLVIVVRPDCESKRTEQETFQKIVNQFEKRKDVRFLFLGDCLDIRNKDKRNEYLLEINCSETKNCLEVGKKIFGDQEENIALVDGVGTIRCYYSSSSQERCKRLIEHIAMMLPDANKRSAE